MSDPEELVLLGGHMEVCSLLIDKERVRDPDLLDVVGSHHQLRHTTLALNIALDRGNSNEI